MSVNNLTPDPTTVEIYKGIDCCDEVKTDLQSIIQDIESLQSQCNDLSNLITQQHSTIEQKLQTIEQEIQTVQARINAVLTRVRRLQRDFGDYVLEFWAWMNWIATALNQINNCACGGEFPLPPPPGNTEK